MKRLTTLFLSLSALAALGDEAVHVEYSIRTPLPRRNLTLAPSGNEYYVSIRGDDRNPGTREKPFRNIQRFADIAQPGDICLVREGTYRETVRPKNGGRTGDPIRYVAYPAEKVTISGTEAITGPWSVYRGTSIEPRWIETSSNCSWTGR